MDGWKAEGVVNNSLCRINEQENFYQTNEYFYVIVLFYKKFIFFANTGSQT